MLLVWGNESRNAGLGEDAGTGDPGWGHHTAPNKLGHLVTVSSCGPTELCRVAFGHAL